MAIGNDDERRAAIIAAGAIAPLGEFDPLELCYPAEMSESDVKIGRRASLAELPKLNAPAVQCTKVVVVVVGGGEEEEVEEEEDAEPS